MGKLIDLSGQRFSNLVVIQRENSSKQGEATWRCKCDCGNETVVRGYSLRHGDTTSCGCNQRINTSAHNTKHAQTNTRLYKIWCGMLSRCNNPNKEHYDRYGGRGIKVCAAWLDYSVFADWANRNGYEPTLTIDRIDFNGNYEPSNCRWISHKQQMRNTSKNRILTLNDKQATMSEWAESLGISLYTLSSRLKRGWTVEQALTAPVLHGATNEQNFSKLPQT